MALRIDSLDLLDAGHGRSDMRLLAQALANGSVHLWDFPDEVKAKLIGQVHESLQRCAAKGDERGIRRAADLLRHFAKDNTEAVALLSEELARLKAPDRTADRALPFCLEVLARARQELEEQRRAAAVPVPAKVTTPTTTEDTDP
jgi:hypothetical protein